MSSVPTKGNVAMLRALLIATVSDLWCFAQVPEMRRGMIFPRSVIKYLNVFESL
jgi:hypothetical protein